MLDTNVALEDRGELVQRQAAMSAWPLLAAAAAIGLSAHLEPPDTQAWRDVAAMRIKG
jgi:hypothetical protein